MSIEKPRSKTVGSWSSSDETTTRSEVMRGLALFLDGMSRAVIFSFGPSLVYRLVYSGTLKLGMDCAKVALPLSVVVAAFLVGRGIGSSIAATIKPEETRLPRIVARLAGIAIALLVFTFGARQSIWWLILVRFASGLTVGILCIVTKEQKKKSDESKRSFLKNESLEEGIGLSHEDVLIGHGEELDFFSGNAKIYMTAFAVSILAGGLLYRHAAGDATFQALTGSKQFTLSPLFLIAISLVGEYSLRCIFSFFRSGKEESTQLEIPSGGIENDYLVASTIDRSNTLETTSRLESSSDAFVACHDRMESLNTSSSTPLQRERLETSDSEFFDCNSVLSGMEELPWFDDDHFDDEENGERKIGVSRYIDGECRDENGAPSYVPNGDSPHQVPENYLILCRRNKRKAEIMWKKTQEWRCQNKVWRIHTLPNRWFRDIKLAYPHFIHGVSKQGYPIIYEQPGKMNLKELFREGCSVNDMLRHYMFFLEFISNHICTKESVRGHLGTCPPPHSSSTWGIMVVMDIKGAGISHLSGDVLTYLKGAGDINNSHYPLSLKRAFLVNSPFWLAGAWKSVKGILPDSVHVDILSSHQYSSALSEFIDEDQIPQEYGGSSPYKLEEHPFEKALHDLVADANKSNESFATVSSAEQEDSFLTLNHLDSARAPELSSWKQALPSNQSTRRRKTDQIADLSAVEASHGSASYLEYDNKKDGYDKCVGGEADIWYVVSSMYVLWSTSQGMLETAIPLWMLTPPELGGLGYAPSRSGVAMFSSVMVLLWVMRTKASKLISRIPKKSPMRSFRIGVGSQAVLLLLLGSIPRSVHPDKRSNAVLVMATTIIFTSCIVLSSMMGRASTTILHRMASSSMAQSGIRPSNWWIKRYDLDTLMDDCTNGRLTDKLNFGAEICGVLLIAPLCSWSLWHERPAPFDGTCCLMLSSLVALVLYICSFSLHLNAAGEFAPHPRDSSTDSRARRCGYFLYEVATVLVSDISSLFDEINRSATPLLGRNQVSWDQRIREK